VKPGLLALVLTLSLGLAYQTFQAIDRPFLNERLPRHEAIVEGRAAVPYRYRLLAPCLTESSVRILAPRLGRERAFLASYFAFDVLGYACTLVAMMLLLTVLGHVPAEALAGSVLVAALVPLTLRFQWYQPWSIVEPGLLALGLAALIRRRTTALVLLTILATLNRETGIYLALAALFAFPRARSSWVAFAAGLGVLVTARLVLGDGPREVSFADAWARNTQPANVRAALLGAALLLGPVPFVAARAFPRAPRVLRRASLLVPVHLALIAVFGVWMETRLLIPLLAVLVPLAWSRWFPTSPALSPAG
jgi:hypothetical protein